MNTNKLSEKEIEEITRFVGFDKPDGFTTIEVYSLLGGYYAMDMIIKDWENKRAEILIQAQIKLMEKGFRFESTKTYVYVGYKYESSPAGVYPTYAKDFKYKDGEYLSALTSAILWAIDKDGE